jgi:hypothetical protein
MFKSLSIFLVMSAICTTVFAQSTLNFVDKNGTKGTLSIPANFTKCLVEDVKEASILDYKGKSELSLCNISSQGDEIFIASYTHGDFYEVALLYTGEAFEAQMFQLRAYRESGYDFANIQNPDAEGLCDSRSVGYLTLTNADLNFCLHK